MPDAAVRVLLLDFDLLPAKAAEALPIIRFACANWFLLRWTMPRSATRSCPANQGWCG